MSSMGVKGRTNSWEAHEHDQQFGKNESFEIGNSQRLRREGNARITKVSAMRPGLVKIIEKVNISRYFESPQTDLHIEGNACCVDSGDTWLLKWVYCLSKSNVRIAVLPIMDLKRWWNSTLVLLERAYRITRIHPQVALKSNIQWLPASLHCTGWMDHCQVCHGCCEAIPILDAVDFEEAYSHIAIRYHSVQWYVRSPEWHFASFG